MSPDLRIGLSLASLIDSPSLQSHVLTAQVHLGDGTDF